MIFLFNPTDNLELPTIPKGKVFLPSGSLGAAVVQNEIALIEMVRPPNLRGIHCYAPVKDLEGHLKEFPAEIVPRQTMNVPKNYITGKEIWLRCLDNLANMMGPHGTELRTFVKEVRQTEW